MPKAPYVRGSATSQDAAEKLRSRIFVADVWIELAARPQGTTCKEVEREVIERRQQQGIARVDGRDSGPSSRQGELHHRARVTVLVPGQRREKSGVYVLRDGLTIETAKELYQRWVKSDDAKPKRKGLPEVVVSACREVAAVLRHSDNEALIDQAMQQLRGAILQTMVAR